MGARARRNPLWQRTLSGRAGGTGSSLDITNWLTRLFLARALGIVIAIALFDVVFTVEYSIRAAQLAAYQLLELPRAVPPSIATTNRSKSSSVPSSKPSSRANSQSEERGPIRLRSLPQRESVATTDVGTATA